MPSYELFFITKRLSKKDLVLCLKRTGELVLQKNGILRKIENLGTRNLPFKLKTPIPGQKRYSSGNFFLYHLDLPPTAMHSVFDSLLMDNELMKVRFCAKEAKIPEDYVCTLDEELKPPALRPTIQSLIKQNEERLKKTKKIITVD